MEKFRDNNKLKEAKAKKMSKQRKFRKGAAAFYIVAMATLILGIIAASFATVVISEVTRSTNEDLAQSALDAANAGKEDAKIAIANYQRCKNAKANGETISFSANVTCEELIDWVDNGIVPDGEDECDLVANALGREIAYEEKEDGTKGEKLGVLVQETNDGDDSMKQYYTCVKIATQTRDLLGTVNKDEPGREFRLKFREPGSVIASGDTGSSSTSGASGADGTTSGTEGASSQDTSGSQSDTGSRVSTKGIKDIDTIRISWHSATEDSDSKNGTAFTWMDLSKGGILGANKVTPAVVQVGVIQTSETFDLTDFDQTKDGQTDRGSVILVPTAEDNTGLTAGESYVSAYNGVANVIDAENGLLKSNDKSYKNLPFVVHCDHMSDYACSADIELPQPVRGNRSQETFMVSVNLPYGQPQTHFSLEFYAGGEQVMLDGVQIGVDSTGRANDVFRRVDTRLEASEAAYPYPTLGLEILGGWGDPALKKNFYSACEYSLTDITGPDCKNNY